MTRDHDTDPRYIVTCSACQSPGHCTEFRVCLRTRRAIPGRTWAELQQLPRPSGSYADRAEALVYRLEHDYDFACEAGPLRLCADWQELVALVGHRSANHDDA